MYLKKIHQEMLSSRAGKRGRIRELKGEVILRTLAGLLSFLSGESFLRERGGGASRVCIRASLYYKQSFYCITSSQIMTWRGDILLIMKAWPQLRLVPNQHLKLKFTHLYSFTICHVVHYLSTVPYIRSDFLLVCLANLSQNLSQSSQFSPEVPPNPSCLAIGHPTFLLLLPEGGLGR